MSHPIHDPVLYVMKALSDESRLLILRLLNEHEYSVGDLAAKVELTEPTVSHHLSRLHAAGLVTLRMAGNQRFYAPNATGLAKFKKLVETVEHFPPKAPKVESDQSWIDALDWAEEDKEVLREYTENGRIKRLPSRQKKGLVLLRWLAHKFAPDQLYTEKEVNAILSEAYERDYVSLRRDLVDFKFLGRERTGARYWLITTEPPKLDYTSQREK